MAFHEPIGRVRFARYGPFAADSHMVQNPPCWRASYALGHPKQSDFIQSNLNFRCFVLDVPVRNVLSSMLDVVPCDRQLQKAHCGIMYTRHLFPYTADLRHL